MWIKLRLYWQHKWGSSERWGKKKKLKKRSSRKKSLRGLWGGRGKKIIVKGRNNVKFEIAWLRGRRTCVSRVRVEKNVLRVIIILCVERWRGEERSECEIRGTEPFSQFAMTGLVSLQTNAWDFEYSWYRVLSEEEIKTGILRQREIEEEVRRVDKRRDTTSGKKQKNKCRIWKIKRRKGRRVGREKEMWGYKFRSAWMPRRESPVYLALYR